MPEADVSQIPDKAAAGLTHKLGPLPVWAWLVIGVVGTAGIYYVFIARKGTGTSGPGFAPGIDLGAMGGGFGGGGGSGTPNPATDGVIGTNAQWLDATVGRVASALNLSASQVRLYLQGYLAGTPFATSQYEAVVANALAGGAPPQTPALPTVNAQPFSSNVSWLDAILQYLPAGTSNSVKNELIAWVNGISTNLSTDAQTALAAAQNVVGQAPNPLTFTTPATPTPAPQTFNVASNWYQQGIDLYNQGNKDVVGIIKQVWGFDDALAQQLYTQQQDYLNKNKVRAPEAQVTAWANNLLATKYGPSGYRLNFV